MAVDEARVIFSQAHWGLSHLLHIKAGQGSRCGRLPRLELSERFLVHSEFCACGWCLILQTWPNAELCHAFTQVRGSSSVPCLTTQTICSLVNGGCVPDAALAVFGTWFVHQQQIFIAAHGPVQVMLASISSTNLQTSPTPILCISVMTIMPVTVFDTDHTVSSGKGDSSALLIPDVYPFLLSKTLTPLVSKSSLSVQGTHREQRLPARPPTSGQLLL